MIWKIIKSIFKNPLIIKDRAKGIIRHIKYPSIEPSAIIRKPLLFTSRYITIGKNVFIYNNARIEGVSNYAGVKYNPQIVIGKGTSIQQNCHITCANSVKIGEYCAITHNVTITDIDHSYEYPPINYPPPISNPLFVNNINIGNNCMIFPNSVILGGSIIGNNCVIGANSVVRGKFPDNCVIVGSPAHIVRRYNTESRNWEKTNPDGSFMW